MRRPLLLLLALLAPVPAAAQEDDSLDRLAMDVAVAHSPREAYRAAMRRLGTDGFEFRMLSLDVALVTLPRPARDGRYAVAVAVELERRDDSTHVTVQGALLRPPGVACSGEECNLQLAAMLEAMAGVTLELDSVRPRPPSRGDSLATAGAYGYSPRAPVQVGGIAEESYRARRQHEYLASLRGPGGEPVRFFRLGSCCHYDTPNSPSGRGLLDAYEVTYDGLAEPVVLYLTLYDEGALHAPEGFTRVPTARETATPAET